MLDAVESRYVASTHPHLRPQVRALHNRSRVVGEEFPVGTAAVGHRRVLHVGLNVVAFAAGAVDSIRPSFWTIHASAVASSGNIRMTLTRERPFR